MKTKLLIYVFLLSGLKTLVMANGATFGGNGDTVIPLNNESIQMVSEDIQGNMGKEDEWIYEIKCKFEFLNLQDSSQTVQIGFPIAAYMAYNHVSGELRDDIDIKVAVGGKGVPVSKKEGGVNKDLVLKENYPLVYVFDVVFGPKEKKEVLVEYDRAWATADGDFVSTYVFRYVTKRVLFGREP